MAAIAMAESGGNPRAHNLVPPDNSYGPWQINMYGKLGPARRKAFGISSNEQLYDPAINARAAAKILASQGPSAWSTYTSGAYKKYMGVSSGTTQTDFNPLDPLDILPEGSTPDLPDVGDITSGLTDVAKLGIKAGEWISNPRNWLNVLYVVIGGSLILVTVSTTVQKQVSGSPIISKLSKGVVSK
jgi:hypothetical protein